MFEIIALLLIWEPPANPIKPDSEVPKWIKMVESDDFGERQKAEKWLLGHAKESVPYLLRDHEDFEVKRVADKVVSESSYFYRIKSVKLIPLGDRYDAVIFKIGEIKEYFFFGYTIYKRDELPRTKFEQKMFKELGMDRYMASYEYEQSIFVAREFAKYLQLMGYREEFLRATFEQR